MVLGKSAGRLMVGAPQHSSVAASKASGRTGDYFPWPGGCLPGGELVIVSTGGGVATSTPVYTLPCHTTTLTGGGVATSTPVYTLHIMSRKSLEKI